MDGDASMCPVADLGLGLLRHPLLPPDRHMVAVPLVARCPPVASESAGGVDLAKGVLFGGCRGGLVAGRRSWRWEVRMSWADCASRLRAHKHGCLGGMAASGWRIGDATKGLKHRGSSPVQFVHWTTVAAFADVVFLVGSVVVLILLRLVPGENLI